MTHLNFFLWEDALSASQRQKYYNEYKAQDIAREFTLIGAVLNEAASNGATDRGIRGENRGVNFGSRRACRGGAGLRAASRGRCPPAAPSGSL